METAKIDTYTGKQIDVLNPQLEKININDIAHSLSNLCRYGGHSPEFYSVAEHCLNCVEHYECNFFELELLLHDSAEYLLVDLPSPIKRLNCFRAYNAIETDLLNSILNKFGLRENFDNHYTNIRKIDLHFRQLEMEYFSKYKKMSWIRKQFEKLNTNRPIKFLKPHVAKKRFLKKFYQLVK